MDSRRERKKRATRARLLEASLTAFERRGYDRATVDEICRVADVAKGTFFNYFPTKEATLLAYYQELVGEVLGSIEEPPDRASTVAALMAYFTTVSDQAEREGARYRILVRELLGNRRLLSANAAAAPRVMAHLTDLVRRGVARGEVRGDVAAEEVVHIVAAVWNAVVAAWGQGDVASLDATMRRQLELLFEGLAA